MTTTGDGKPEIHIYTDGGCHGNPGPGGWAFVLHAGEETYRRYGGEANTTNNRMELRAVISSLEFVAQELDAGNLPLHVYTDSQYVQRGMSEWLSRWLRNGFKTAGNKPVKNKELWVELHELSKQHDIRWHWVRGHAGDRFNEECDGLVQQAIEELS